MRMRWGWGVELLLVCSIEALKYFSKDLLQKANVI